MINLDTIGTFTWNFGQEFFIETAEGNYIWNDPDYSGDNTIRKFNGTYDEWCKKTNIPYGRDKGVHRIGDYCEGASIQN